MNEQPTADAASYHALVHGAVLIDRADRALLELRGADRAAWLHNLVTNQVKTLQPGEGNYAFACNVQGRILFDLNILVRPDALWVDLDQRWVDAARKHFEKYIITEDVSVTDRSSDFTRLGLAGPRTVELMAALGAPHVKAMPALAAGQVTIGGITADFIRHGFCGPLAVEMFVPASGTDAVLTALTDPAREPHATPIGPEAVEIRRIEAGIPWPGTEIHDDVLPPETGQIERGISYVKGCYLGQEVVERMRSRGVIAKKLVGLFVDRPHIPPPRATLLGPDGKQTGHVTSSCLSISLSRVIALGYAKTAHAAPGTVLQVAWDGGTATATVTPLPFVPPGG